MCIKEVERWLNNRLPLFNDCLMKSTIADIRANTGLAPVEHIDGAYGKMIIRMTSGSTIVKRLFNYW